MKKAVTSFSPTFWIANGMELVERWAFYGFFMLFANYLTLSPESGALGLSQTDKGIIMGVGTAILYFLPVITGALADRYGYRRVLLISYVLYIAAFLLMPYCQSFWSVFINYIFLALAAALFKPIISATIAHLTTKENSSIGFGIFYQMVNVGAFIGPLVSLYYGAHSYNNVFYVSAIVISLNFLLLLFFKEPTRIFAKKDNHAKFSEEIITILKNIWIALSDTKFVIFLILISGFWTMYYQLFYTLPVFIEQWVDMEMLYNWLSSFWPWLAGAVGENGTIKAEYLTDMDALFIIVFQIFVSLLVRRARPIVSMIAGFFICSIGMGMALMTQNPFFILLSLLIFAIGEMAGSPKINEYIGRIAPKEKLALYMGCSFLPVTLGNLFTGILSGPVYEKMADKTVMIYSEIQSRGISIPALEEKLSPHDLMIFACDKLNLSESALTNLLWNKYHPSSIWMVIAGIGILTAILLFIYDRFIPQKTEEN